MVDLYVNSEFAKFDPEHVNFPFINSPLSPENCQIYNFVPIPPSPSLQQLHNNQADEAFKASELQI